MAKKTDWAEERLLARGKGGKVIGEWTRGNKGKTENHYPPLEPGGKNNPSSFGKRTYHNSGKTHLHGLFAKGGKKKSW